MESAWFKDPPVTRPSESTQSDPPVAPGRYRLRLAEVTSVVILTHRRSRVYTGSVRELQDAYHRVFVHNVLLGWWGIPFGLIWTPLSIARNRKALAALRSS